MGIKAVIDTNVLVSSFISKNTNSPTVRIIKAIAEGIFTPVYSDDILSEYEEVLGRGHFKLDPSAISILIQRIKEIGEAVSPIDSEEDYELMQVVATFLFNDRIKLDGIPAINNKLCACCISCLVCKVPYCICHIFTNGNIADRCES